MRDTMAKDISDYPELVRAQIKKAGSIEAWKEQLKDRQRKGGQVSTYKRTAEIRRAASERAKAQWAVRRGQDTK